MRLGIGAWWLDGGEGPPETASLAGGSGTQLHNIYDRFRHHQRNRGRSLPPLFAEFARLRAGNLEPLPAWDLGDAELELLAMHPSLGAVTLRQLLAACVSHDLGHVAQSARVMAKQYRD